MLHWQGLRMSLGWKILFLFNPTFLKRMEPSQKKGEYYTILYYHHNDYIDSPLLSYQILIILELSHSHILIKLFCTILMDP